MSVRRLATALLAVSTLTLAACATPQTVAVVEAPGDLPPQAAVADVPFFPQEDNYCGPAALATALGWSGVAVAPDDLAARVYTPEREGTLQNDIVAAARREGRLAVPVGSLRDVMAELAAGHPVVVFQNLGLSWYPQWHFAVAVGYDLAQRDIILRSGREAERVTALETFERTWERGDRWAVVVLPPDRLPASAEEDAVLRAAAGLERAGRGADAARAYATILERWPDSFAALMGLGNARYGEGDLAAAEAAFRQAIAASPERAEAWNNLAYVLAAGGRTQEARAAAREAIRLSPDNEAPYRETLEEVSGG
jgi:tetratricopeptide (TPR) repeat protein